MVNDVVMWSLSLFVIRVCKCDASFAKLGQSKRAFDSLFIEYLVHVTQPLDDEMTLSVLTCSDWSSARAICFS